MAAVDAGTSGSNRADIYHSTPSLLQHMRHGQLGDDERTPQIHIDCVIPFFNINFEDVASPLAVAGIDYENVWMLAMGFFDLVEQALKISLFGDIALVG